MVILLGHLFIGAYLHVRCAFNPQGKHLTELPYLSLGFQATGILLFHP